MRAQPDASSRTSLDEAAPPDIAVMRASALRSLSTGLHPDELATLADMLRGHLRILVPEVEALARRRPLRSSPSRVCALACVGDARMKLRAGNGETRDVREAVVERLGRAVNALCEHYEGLTRQG